MRPETIHTRKTPPLKILSRAIHHTNHPTLHPCILLQSSLGLGGLRGRAMTTKQKSPKETCGRGNGGGVKDPCSSSHACHVNCDAQGVKWGGRTEGNGEGGTLISRTWQHVRRDEKYLPKHLPSKSPSKHKKLHYAIEKQQICPSSPKQDNRKNNFLT